MFKMSFNIYEYISDIYINVYINNNAKGILISSNGRLSDTDWIRFDKHCFIRYFVDIQQPSVSLMT